MKVHVVDGTYELFRAYFGAPKKLGLSGREVGACAGILRSLVVLLREESVTHIACAFDHVIESFRNEIFPGYKTSEGVPEDLLSQFGLAEDVTRALGMTTWPMVKFEADDAIATAAARFADDARVEQVVIASPDKDLTQCVRGSRVVVWDRRRGIVLDEEGVRAKFGVSPESIPDFLALVGDAADGLPGIFGWGKKSAAEVLARYGHVEDIPENASLWDAKPRRAYDLAAELRHERENALLYRKLATLRLDVPLAEGLEDLAWKGGHRDALEALCRELGEANVLPRFLRLMGSAEIR
ncbi:MAG: 5'-3' exonuclease [Vicinamibacteria bacterium]